MDWIKRWNENNTPWDLGKEHRLTEALIKAAESFELPSGTLYVPGCGRAHDAAFLARRGYTVQATDLSARAIEQAHSLYQNLDSLELAVENVFDKTPSPKIFGAVFDRAMLCALNEPDRALYLKAIEERLVEGGFFLGILFSNIDVPPKDGPPFAIDDQALEKLFSGFDILLNKKVTNEGPLSLIKEERLFIARIIARTRG